MRPGKRRYNPDDAFFVEGNIVCRLLQEKFQYIPEVEDVMESDVHNIDCQMQGCFQQFPNLHRYEEHYASRHRNVCQACGKILPTKHLLEIHLHELHNPMFDILSRSNPMYQCLVSSCSLLFHNAKKRKKHLIDFHKYPSSFRFERMVTSAPKSKPVGSKQKYLNTDHSMDTSTESVNGESENGGTQSRFKYTYRVPDSFTFGHGVQKGFVRKRPKRPKGNHLVKPKASINEDTVSNIENVDMSDIADALTS